MKDISQMTEKELIQEAREIQDNDEYFSFSIGTVKSDIGLWRKGYIHQNKHPIHTFFRDDQINTWCSQYELTDEKVKDIFHYYIMDFKYHLERECVNDDNSDDGYPWFYKEDSS